LRGAPSFFNRSPRRARGWPPDLTDEQFLERRLAPSVAVRLQNRR
jgi:hypothetical protein